ncbi:hypothetical protein R2E40_05120 [Aeromonas sp. CD]|uniref:hypothetical protein n=1 Tax=Aeromonas sp. CD TaxID=3080830 RepID=UPI002966A503|nr:hypothetical protein [Aeromonas sp. CD]WOX53501.1 hypothetical protein R2E40_05120 [Aeromonas sp. CD]
MLMIYSYLTILMKVLNGNGKDTYHLVFAAASAEFSIGALYGWIAKHLFETGSLSGDSTVLVMVAIHEIFYDDAGKLQVLLALSKGVRALLVSLSRMIMPANKVQETFLLFIGGLFSDVFWMVAYGNEANRKSVLI